MSDDSDSLPKRRAGDYVHTGAKAMLSLIPIAGGPAVELFSLLLAPPLEKRKETWLEDLYERLKRMEEQVAGFHFEDLEHNEVFVSAAVQAIRSFHPRSPNARDRGHLVSGLRESGGDRGHQPLSFLPWLPSVNISIPISRLS